MGRAKWRQALGPKQVAMLYAGLYLVAGTVWLLLVDVLGAARLPALVQNVCDWAFMLGSAAVLYAVIWRELAARAGEQDTLREQAEMLSLAHVLLMDMDGRIISWNPGAEALYGWTRAEAIGQLARDLLKTRYPQSQAEIITELLRNGHWEGELLHYRRDGSVVAVASHWTLHRDERNRPRRILEVNNDITAFKIAEEHNQRLSKIYAVLSDVNHAIVHLREPQELFRSACTAAVQKGDFRLAWVGLADDHGVVQPVASAGETDYLKDIRVTIRAEDVEGCGPMGTAIREGRTVISEHFEADTRMAPWLERAKQHGLHYMAAVPLRLNGRVIGAIGFYAARPRFFNTEEIRMLQEITSELSLALQSLENETGRVETETQLKREHEWLQLCLDIAGVMLVVLDERGRVKLINRKGLDILGYPQEADLLGRDWFATCLPPETREKTFAAFQNILAGKLSLVEFYENEVLTRTGQRRRLAFHNTVIRDHAGHIIGTLSSGEDITEHRPPPGAAKSSPENLIRRGDVPRRPVRRRCVCRRPAA